MENKHWSFQSQPLDYTPMFRLEGNPLYYPLLDEVSYLEIKRVTKPCKSSVIDLLLLLLYCIVMAIDHTYTKDTQQFLKELEDPESEWNKPKKRIRNTSPTLKQIKALQYYNSGMSMRKALREAGYKESVVQGSTAFFKQKGVQEAVKSLQFMFTQAGLTNEKLTTKIAEFVDAKKIDHSHTEPDKVVPDYDTQLKGVKLWQETLDKTNPNATKGKIKKQLTVTEFVTGEEDKVDGSI